MTTQSLAIVPVDDVTDDRLRFGRIEIRPTEYSVLIDDRRVPLTVREFEVLWTLVQQPDVVLPRQRVYQEVWGASMAYRDRSVDTFVRKVRIKLAEVAPEWIFIHTHFGIGYRFSPEPVDRDSDAPSSPDTPSAA